MQEVITSTEKPPIFDRLNKQFGADWKDVIIAWDGKIYASKEIPPQKIVHEKVHLDRQAKIGNEAWWNLYLWNNSFRLEEEKLAFRAEINFLKKYIKNKEDCFQMIRELCHTFSSSNYGNLCTADEAMKLLR